jgi:hypothetical protein
MTVIPTAKSASSLVGAGQATGMQVVPTSRCANWVDVHLLPTAADAGGDNIRQPGLIYATDDGNHLLLDSAGNGTSILLRCKYPVSWSGITGPTLQVFGADAIGNLPSLWQLLVNNAGSSDIVITADLDNTDVVDDAAVFAYTAAVQVDLQGNKFAMICIKVAMVESGEDGGATIQARIL